MKKHPFNMIEIVLAIAVIAIGMVSIMGLFPIGLEASGDAMAKSYAAESADEFLHYLERYLREDWDNNHLENAYLPTGEPADADKDNFSVADSDTVSLPVATADARRLTPSLYLNKNENGIFKVIRYLDNTPENNQYDSGEIVDFEAIVAVWQEDIDILDTDNDPTTPHNRNIGLKIVMEISWPARAPYSGRKKDEYVLELFNR